MAISRFDILVREARDKSGNQVYGDSNGRPQRSFVSAGNAAQDRLYALMLQKRPSLFVKQGYIDTVANQAEYDLPSDVFLHHRIQSVECLPTNNAQLYYNLNQRTPRTQVSTPGLPESYFLRNKKIVLSPYPATGFTQGLRLNYQFVIPRLDIRRGKIAAVTDLGTTTRIELADDDWLTAENESDLENEWIDYIAVVSSTGTYVAADQGIQVISYDPATRYLVVNGDPTAGMVANNYVVFSKGGTDTTTHCVLPDTCERYLVEYMTMRAQMSDTSSEAAVTSPLLQAIEREILDSVEMLEEDLFAIPILDASLLGFGDDPYSL